MVFSCNLYFKFGALFNGTSLFKESELRKTTLLIFNALSGRLKTRKNRETSNMVNRICEIEMTFIEFGKNQFLTFLCAA